MLSNHAGQTSNIADGVEGGTECTAVQLAPLLYRVYSTEHREVGREGRRYSRVDGTKVGALHAETTASTPADDDSDDADPPDTIHVHGKVTPLYLSCVVGVDRDYNVLCTGYHTACR